jgi:glycosyltransferase involved in cell wall biosynthesis
VRLGIDACSWSNRRGFGRFTRELTAQMVAQAGAHEVTLLVDRTTAEEWPLPRAAHVDVVATAHPPTEAATARGARSPADLWRLSRAAARHAFDVFFFPAVYSFFPLLRRVPTVVTFHDAIAEGQGDLVFPARGPRALWAVKSWMARRQADLILTVSGHARDEIVRRFGRPARVRVIAEAASDAFRPLDDPEPIRRARERHRLPEGVPLLLHVGGHGPHKNLPRLLEALSLVGPERPWHLALVGDDAGFHSEIDVVQRTARALGLEGRMTVTGAVADSDLVALYSAATALVLPSLAEGFGLPAVEAMACGLPVAASRRGALPEVLAQAAIYFDPTDPADMAAALDRLLGDGALRARLRAAGRERARAFSWAAAARAALAVCEEAAGA